MKSNVKVRYLDIDGVLVTYLADLSMTERDHKIKEMQEVFDEFKLDFPSRETLMEEWQTNNINIYFKLSDLFSRDMLAYIVDVNTNLGLNLVVNEWNKKEPMFEWNYTVKKVGTLYEYHFRLLNRKVHTYKYHQVDYQPKKELPKHVSTCMLSKDAVVAFNKLMDERPCETLCITSAWGKVKSISLILDLLRYQGIHFPADMKIETLRYTDFDRGLSIAADILKRNARDSYDVIDDDFLETYAMFKAHVIKPHNGLTMEDVDTYLTQEKEKVKVIRYGN